MPTESREPGPDFRWRQESWGPVLSAIPLEGSAVHFFTTRALPLRGHPALELDGWNRVADAAGVQHRHLLRLDQVHGARVVLGRQPAPISTTDEKRPVGDIIVSSDRTIALAVQVADCVPLLLSDSTTGAVAAVHAGWRGTLAGAAGEAVRALATHFGSLPGRLRAAIGPSIGPCCYRVGGDVRRAFAESQYGQISDRWFRASDAGDPRLDLWMANRDQLTAAGLPDHGICTAELCTACRADLFHSYRRDGSGTGRMVAVIRAGAGGSSRSEA